MASILTVCPRCGAEIMRSDVDEGEEVTCDSCGVRSRLVYNLEEVDGQNEGEGID